MSASQPTIQPLTGTIPCVDPATGADLGTAPIMTPAAVDTAVVVGPSSSKSIKRGQVTGADL